MSLCGINYYYHYNLTMLRNDALFLFNFEGIPETDTNYGCWMSQDKLLHIRNLSTIYSINIKII